MSELEGRTAIVTGAGSPRGMGRAIVETLAAQGANIVASDMAQGDPDMVMEALGYRYGAGEGLEESVAAAKALGVQAEAVCADVTQAEQVEALAAKAKEFFGRIDILVNVAGGSWGSNRVADYEPEAWLKTLHVNLFGTFLTTKYCLPHLEANKCGSIVNIASIAASRAHEMLSAYGAAKAAIVQFTRDVACESGPSGVRANVILPGDVQTDMFAMEMKGEALIHGKTEEEALAASAASTPVGRIGTPKDVADLVAFLASDRAAFVTGVAIPLTGGKDLPFRTGG